MGTSVVFGELDSVSYTVHTGMHANSSCLGLHTVIGFTLLAVAQVSQGDSTPAGTVLVNARISHHME